LGCGALVGGDLVPWLAGIRDCGDWLPLAGLAGRDSVALAVLRGLASLGKRAEKIFEEKACTLRNVRSY
jgi:hypothetical protein